MAVTTSPQTVGSLATLTFTVSLTSVTGFFATGDTIVFNVPTPASFIPSTTLSNCVSATTGISITSCTITSSMATMVLSTATSLNKCTFRVLTFKNPNSDTPVPLIATTLVHSSGTTRATHTSATLSNLLPDTMTAGSITPGSFLVGDSGVSITVAFTPKNYLKTNGKVVVYFPPWNPEEGTRADHYIQSTSPSCGSVSGMSTFLSCTYNRDTRKLTVTSPVSADTTGISLSFSVDNFKNPYSGKPRTGFYISTTDSSDGQIDSTLYLSTPISIQMTEWASLSGATIGRDDAVTEVGELSIGAVYFALDFPVDQYCRVDITFPTDMPLTSALTKLSSSGIISASNKSPTSISLATNTFTLEGCSQYSQQSAAELIMSMYYIKNKGYLEKTGTFVFKFYALSGPGGTAYPIA